jgi:serine/threonine-protein kinase
MVRDELLGGRYELMDQLGSGGMAVVWRARDMVLGRTVAVKLLAGPHANDPDSRQRIRDEARAAAALSHPNIAQVYDYGESNQYGTLLPYVVMELIRGRTLQERHNSGPLSPAFAMRVGAEVAAALAAAHAHGLAHRDIKPANIMLPPSGAKVVDFGIAAAIRSGRSTDENFEVLGTPAYLAPERLTDDAVEPASDVYALGVLLYRMLANESPWSAETTTQMLTAHIYIEPVPLPPMPGVPEYVVNLCNRCLSKDPTLRPSARDVAALLAHGAGLRVVDDVQEPAPVGSADDREPSVLIRPEAAWQLPVAPPGSTNAAADSAADPDPFWAPPVASSQPVDAAWADPDQPAGHPQPVDAAWTDPDQFPAPPASSSQRIDWAGADPAPPTGSSQRIHPAGADSGPIPAPPTGSSQRIHPAGADSGPIPAPPTGSSQRIHPAGADSGPIPAPPTGSSQRIDRAGADPAAAPASPAGPPPTDGPAPSKTPASMAAAVSHGHRAGSAAATDPDPAPASPSGSPPVGRPAPAKDPASNAAAVSRKRRAGAIGVGGVLLVAALLWMFFAVDRDDQGAGALPTGPAVPGSPRPGKGTATRNASTTPASPVAGAPTGRAGQTAGGSPDRPAATAQPAGPTGRTTETPRGQNPTTTAPAPAPTTTAAEPPEVRTLSSSGGSVQATCPTDTTAELLSWTATKPFKVNDVNAGPATAATVWFKHGNDRVLMTVTCTDGRPSTENAES